MSDKPKSEKTNAFLSAAKKGAAAKEAARQPAQRDYSALEWLEKFYAENLAPVVEQLKSLPEKGGRSFTSSLTSHAERRLMLQIDYTGGGDSGSRGGLRRYAPLADRVAIVLDKSGEGFFAQITRYDQHDPENTRKHLTKVVSVADDLQAILGDWVANVAADRVPELEDPKAVDPFIAGSRQMREMQENQKSGNPEFSKMLEELQNTIRPGGKPRKPGQPRRR